MGKEKGVFGLYPKLFSVLLLCKSWLRGGAAELKWREESWRRSSSALAWMSSMVAVSIVTLLTEKQSSLCFSIVTRARLMRCKTLCEFHDREITERKVF